ncbi:type II secretion protein, partial [Photobacterium damselae subsp. damselae]
PQTFIEQMGISPAIVAAPDLMRLFVHQKLVRKLCPHCALSYQEAIESSQTKAKAQLLSTLLPDHYQHCRVKSPQGCSAYGGK